MCQWRRGVVGVRDSNCRAFLCQQLDEATVVVGTVEVEWGHGVSLQRQVILTPAVHCFV